MKKLILITIGILAAVAVRAENVVTLPAVTGAPGDVVDVTVTLDNDQPVSAMQLQIPVTDAISVVSGSETLSQRAASHSATVGIKDGVLNIMVYALNMAPISGNSGEVLSFKVHLGDIPTIVPLQCTKLTLTDVEGNPVDGTVADGSVTILAPKARLGANTIDFGHVPIRSTYNQSIYVENIGTAPLVITGIDPSASEFSSTTAFPLTIEGGQSSNVDITYAPTERGAIDESVRLLSNNIDGNNTVRLLADPFAVNELHVMDATGYADSTVTIHLKVNNMDAISGFQFEFDLPKQLQYVDGSFKLTERSNGHALTVTHKDGKLVAIAYSVLDKTFKGEDGEIATFDVIISGRYGTELSTTKAILTTNYKGKDIDVTSGVYSGNVNIYSPVLEATSDVDMGSTPVTMVARSNVSVFNYGSAPLTIEKVTFDTIGFSIKNALPITIEPWNNVNLNIEYNGQAETEFKGIMNIYSNDPDHHLHAVTITGSRFAPNYMEFTAADVMNDNDLLVDFALDTYDAMDGMQFDITYPAEWFEPNGEYVMTERAPGFVVTERVIEPGVVRCFLYSLGSSNIQAGTGKIGTIKFSTKEDTPAGTYTLNISNIKLGTSELNDKYAGQNLSCTFNVSHFYSVTSVELDKHEVTLNIDETADLVATVLPEKATDKNITWSTSNEAVATVDESGKVTAIAAGKATITVKTADGSELTDTCVVTVNPLKAASIVLDKHEVSLNIDETTDLVATVLPEKATDKNVTWSTSNEAVATVDENGKVTAIAAGKSTITVKTADGSELTDTCVVTVNPRLVTAIELDKTSISLQKGETVTLIATVSPEDATHKDVEWTSSDEEVATVSQDGVVTAVKPGNATITAMTTDGSELAASCEVKVSLPGDVNGDGKVDIADINCVINVILENESADIYEGRADVNGDGKVDIADINSIIDLILSV